ncbi:MAG: hypothetical protein WCK49_02525, partial [Myxococcaceae bacterium]
KKLENCKQIGRNQEELETARVAELEKARLAEIREQEALLEATNRERRIAENNLKLQQEAVIRAEKKRQEAEDAAKKAEIIRLDREEKERLAAEKEAAEEQSKLTMIKRTFWNYMERTQETYEMLREEFSALYRAKEQLVQELDLGRSNRVGREQLQEVLDVTRGLKELDGHPDIYAAVYQNNPWAIQYLLTQPYALRFGCFGLPEALALAITRDESRSTIRPLLFAPSGKPRSHTKHMLQSSCVTAIKHKKLHSLKILIEIMQQLEIKQEEILLGRQTLSEFAADLFGKPKKGSDEDRILKIIREWI